MKHTDKHHRPESVRVDHSAIPDVLRKERNWVMWRFEWVEDKDKPAEGKWAKVPYHPQNYRAASTKPENWSTFETCVAEYEQSRNKFDGIGFVFSENLPFIGIDLDACVEEGEGDFHLNPFASRVVEKLATYTELSPSRTGVHCIGVSDMKVGTRVQWKDGNGKINEIEVYKTGRYFTFTGLSWHEKILDVQDVTAELEGILTAIKKTPEKSHALSSLDVSKRIEMALKNPKLEQLYYGNTTQYGGDDSRADMALCSLLVYYCDGNRDILDVMFRSSKLMRSKWDELRGAETYGNITLTKALASHTNYISVRRVTQTVEPTFENRKTRRFTFSDLWDAAMEYRNNPGARGVSTGWPGLDQFYTPAKGCLSVVTGTPNSGKTTWVDVLTYNIAVKHKWRITYASFETQPIQRHILNLCQIHLAQPTFSFLPDAASDDDMNRARDEIGEYFNFIMPDEHEMDMLSILDYVDDEIKEYGIEGFVLDPYTELDHTRMPSMTQTEHIEVVLKQLQQFTRHRDIHSWLIAHPTKGGDTFVDGVPTLYSINGSAHFANKADYGIVVHRNEQQETSVIVRKVRNDLSGTKGTTKFRFDVPSKQYRELDSMPEGGHKDYHDR